MMERTERINGQAVTVAWNGGSTFNVSVDGVTVDAWTRYGDPMKGTPCDETKAREAIADLFETLRDNADEMMPHYISEREWMVRN